MKSILLKIGSIVAIIALFVVIISGINASAEQIEEKKEVDNRPLINTTSLFTDSHNVEITAFGEVTPLEKTILAAQVSGEIIHWNKNFVAGGIVKRGDVLFTIEPDKYEADVLQAEAQVSLAQATLEEELARQKVAQREARSLGKDSVSDLYLRKPQVLSARAQVKSAEAALRIANRNLSKTQVVAPYDALIISRDIGSGQYVSAGMKVAELNNIETAEITVPIAGFDRPFLSSDVTGIKATVITKDRVPAIYRGYVDRDLGVVDQNTRMLNLVVRVDDPYQIKNNASDAKLKFGSYVEVSFAGKSLENVYKVPQSLVNNKMLWLVNDNDELQSHRVEVIREEGSFFYVTAKLNQDARMAMNLPEYPQNGMQVRVQNEQSDLISFRQ